jgi:hypothetical protein
MPATKGRTVKTKGRTVKRKDDGADGYNSKKALPIVNQCHASHRLVAIMFSMASGIR